MWFVYVHMSVCIVRFKSCSTVHLHLGYFLGILNSRVKGHLWLTNWHKETRSEFVLIRFTVVSEE